MSITTGPVLPPKKPKPKPKPKPVKLIDDDELYIDWDKSIENVSSEHPETWIEVFAYVVDEEDDTKTGFAVPKNGEYQLENETNYISIENGKISNIY